MSGSLFEQYKASLRRGHLAALAGDLDDALDAYRAASRLVPERTLPIASQGTVLHQLDRWPEAAEAFDRALNLAPDDEVTLRARASAREQRGMRSGAAADFERLAFVLDVAGRAVEAADAARRAAQLEHSATRATLAARLALTATHDADRGAGAAPHRAPAAADFAAVEAELVAAPSAPPAAAPTPAWLEHAVASVPATAVEAPAATVKPATAAPEPDGPAQEPAPEPASSVEPGQGPDGQFWPAIDLPSPVPPPIVGSPPDPEKLLVEAAAHVRAGEPDAARNLMLTAAMVHRSAGRLDAALEACLLLLGTAPGDPYVHLAIANLQLDRGWTEVATEKLNLLLRLTSLTGATQAEADVHGLAAERLRDDPVASVATR